MQLQDNSKLPKYSQEEETNSPDIIEKNEEIRDETEDADPPPDEEDLEKNRLKK